MEWLDYGWAHGSQLCTHDQVVSWLWAEMMVEDHVFLSEVICVNIVRMCEEPSMCVYDFCYVISTCHVLKLGVISRLHKVCGLLLMATCVQIWWYHDVWLLAEYSQWPSFDALTLVALINTHCTHWAVLQLLIVRVTRYLSMSLSRLTALSTLWSWGTCWSGFVFIHSVVTSSLIWLCYNVPPNYVSKWCQFYHL